VPKPVALCVENLDARTDSERFLQCVAVGGSEPGLTLDADGVVAWRGPKDDVACELWISLDERLILFRPEETTAGRVHLHRGGRSLEIPGGKPVVLLDQDELGLGERRLRLHVHGDAPDVHAPTFFVPDAEPAPEEVPASRAAQVAATALAIGVAVGTAGCTKNKVEIRDEPPKVAPPRPDASAVQPDTRPPVDLLVPDKAVVKAPKKPVEVRVRPPRVARPPDPPKKKLGPLDKPQKKTK